MRVFAILAAAFFVLPNPASAQSWTEYDYPDAGFAIHFPSAPTVADGLYETGAGSFVNARIFSLQSPGGLYTMTVADLAGTGADQQSALAQAVDAARSQGVIQLDIPARVNAQRGRQLSISGADGSHSTLAIFFAKDHLFQIEATTPASSPDPQSGDAIRFQQSLRFTGDYAGRRFAQGTGGPGGPGRPGGPGAFRGPDGTQGQFGGRFRRGGRAGRGPGDAGTTPSNTPPDQAQPQQPAPAQGP